MTAEIAILNKTAVALAADSAVTISSGSTPHKIFDSADKLFELSCDYPIGIMINNDMNFMETPLPVLIKRYRADGRKFDKVEDAAYDFLNYLDEFGARAPESVQLRHLERHVMPIADEIQLHSQRILAGLIDSDDASLSDRPFTEVMAEQVSRAIEQLDAELGQAEDALFIGQGRRKLSKSEKEAVSKVIDERLTVATDEQRADLATIVIKNIGKVVWGAPNTGLIVAGFADDELFPTLVSFEVYGTIVGRLKYTKTNNVDIDRNGVRARVLPFAQREMVERFLYGLDDDIQDRIMTFCRQSVTRIADQLIESLDLPEGDQKALVNEALVAEKAFFNGLEKDSFAAIRQKSRMEIEDMVEFMPKSEMAEMAEALVNLTSIKRKVSQGMETVGGPIDVAVISKAEGFVWVKRKHYFPQELNQSYFSRKWPEFGQHRESKP